jgi:hypothetical protein
MSHCYMLVLQVLSFFSFLFVGALLFMDVSGGDHILTL